ncbi:MAG TPA: FAD-binding oxidoreductase, partial [Anaerolineales bacterium]|nr:FAD-binding oxidoreductase [Anaerolineales bacterium]
WNGMIDRHPQLIVQPANVQDVIAAVTFARENNILVSVRGGGHSVAGLSTNNNGLVIDLVRMNRVSVEAEKKVAHIQGGAIWGQVDAATQAFGLAAPAGVVSDTGVAGLTLGGGLGWLRTKYGLSADNLLSAEVVTADGRLITASATKNTDLLWALRGGGGNFGIVTEFTFQLHPVGPEVMFVFVFHKADTMDEMKAAVRFFEEHIFKAPEEVSSIGFAGIFPPGAEAFPAELHGRHFFAIGALYAGDPQEGERVLAPFRNFREPAIDFSGRMPYTEAQKMFDEDYPKYEMRYYWKSLNLTQFGEDTIQRYVEHAWRQPSPYSTTDLWPIRGAVARGSDLESSYFGRHARFLLNPEANWITPAEDGANIAWVRDFVEGMQEFSDGSRYLNFAGLQEEGDAMMLQAFGEHYERLQQIKRKYDPDNLFRLNQNVKPTS